MKKYRNLFLLVIFTILIIPTNVFAKETLTDFNMELDEPVEEGTPDDKVKLTYSNDNDSFSREFDIVWCETADYISCTEMNNTKFKDSYGYEFEFKNDTEYDAWIDELEQQGYEIASSVNRKNYFNGNMVIPSSLYAMKKFVIGGISELEIIIEEPIVGNEVNGDAVLRYTVGGITTEVDMKAEWYEIDTNDNINKVTSKTFEEGKRYLVASEDDIEDLVDSKYKIDDQLLMDFRVKMLINGKSFYSEEDVIFGPLEKTVKVSNNLTNIESSNINVNTVINKEYSTILTALEKYTLPTSILVTIDGVEIASDKYTYDIETGKLTIPASLVTGDIEIEAIATLIKDKNKQTNNPNTYDGIGSSILIGIISLISLIGILIYNKRKDGA